MVPSKRLETKNSYVRYAVSWVLLRAQPRTMPQGQHLTHRANGVARKPGADHVGARGKPHRRVRIRRAEVPEVGMEDQALQA